MTRKAPTRRRTGRLEAARKLNTGLRHELRKFPAPAVEMYVRYVGGTLGKVRITREFADVRAWRDSMAKLAAASESLADELAKFPMSAPLPGRLDRMEEPTAYDEQFRDEFHRAAWAARTAVKALRKQIARSLERTPARPRGRPQADDAGLLADLARRYLETFGERPRSTPGGPFANVASLVLEHLHGGVALDVSRQVRAALKSL